ncbi:MAG: CotH kinase family protein, partial [Chryseobacterium sp.]|nr:CotH kinase family protein [Chryseobacterium sp.]
MIIVSACQKEVKLDKNVNLFDDEQVHYLKLISYQSDMWKNLEEDKKLKSEKEKTNYQYCKIEIDGNTIDSIGVRFKGESSYDFQTNKKKSFKIQFNRFIKKQKYQGLYKISLDNQFRDPTFMREKLMLDLIASEGLPVSRSSYCKVYFNDEYLGLYLVVEDIGKSFIKKNFTYKSGNLYNGKPMATLKIPTDSINTLKRC